MADPAALPLAVAAAQAVQMIGLPEAAINLSHAVIYLALAPKSNSVITAMGAASADIRAGLAGPVPAHLRDAHYRGAARIGHGAAYQYSHDTPTGVATQQYAPDPIAGRDYYAPSDHGAERPLTARVARLRALLRGEPEPEPDP
jgi:putative ATPase